MTRGKITVAFQQLSVYIEELIQFEIISLNFISENEYRNIERER